MIFDVGSADATSQVPLADDELAPTPVLKRICECESSTSTCRVFVYLGGEVLKCLTGTTTEHRDRSADTYDLLESEQHNNMESKKECIEIHEGLTASSEVALEAPSSTIHGESATD
jgi:hypothetical protein